MGNKISLGMMELKKITIKTEETEEDEKTSYVHSFEHVAGDGKFTATLPKRLDMKMGKIMELAFVDNQTKLSEFKEQEPDEKKEAIKKGQEAQKRITEEAVNTEVETEPAPKKKSSKKKTEKKEDRVLAEKEIGKDTKPDESCKFHYKGGLCANSKTADPMCHGTCPEKVERGAEDKSEMEKPATEKKGGKAKAKAEKTKAEDEAKLVEEEKGKYEMTGTLLLKKTDFPTDVLGGLKKDIVVEKNMTDNFLYAHATSMVLAKTPSDNDAFVSVLKEKTGLDWEWVTGNTYAADQKQLNKE